MGNLIRRMALVGLGVVSLSSCTVNLPASTGGDGEVIVTTPPPVTVTAVPSPMPTPPPPAPTVTVTAQPVPRPVTTVTIPPTRTDYPIWLCDTPATALPAIVPGESSGNVRLLQWAVKAVGYYSAAIGGNYGQQTLQAVSQFQLDHGLGGSGNVATNTWSWLQYFLCSPSSFSEEIRPQ